MWSDPEGNTVEVYVNTPWYVPQPGNVPLDLDQPDDVIEAGTKARCLADPPTVDGGLGC